MFNLPKLKNLDNTFLLLILGLSIIGALNVFSSTFFLKMSPSTAFFNQIFFYFIGLVIFFGLSAFNYRKLNKFWVILFGVFIISILLILVLIFGSSAGEAQRWLLIGNFTLQPSEFAKLSIVIILAFALSYRKKQSIEKIFSIYFSESKDLKSSFIKFYKSEYFLKFIFSFACILGIIGLVFLEKSLGVTLMLLGITFLTLLSIFPFTKKNIFYIIVAVLALNASFGIVNFSDFYTKVNFSMVIFGFDILVLGLSIILILIVTKLLRANIILTAIVFSVLIFMGPVSKYVYNNVLEPYQKNRIETFFKPTDIDNLKEDWNRRQALTAIGSGQMFGNGFLNGPLIQKNLLPYAFTDFAYAGFSEQFGFLGSTFLLGVYAFLLLKVLSIANNTHGNFGKIICIGVAAMIFLNTIQHVGMNMGLLPITGVPLPLISYGGSSVIATMIGLGLVNSIHLDNLYGNKEVINLTKGSEILTHM